MSEPQPGLGGAPGLLGGRPRPRRHLERLPHDAHPRPARRLRRLGEQGATGWSYAEVLPYLQRLERQRDDTNPTAGRSGPISVVNARDTGNPISQTFIDACVELGYPQVDDFNAADVRGRLAPRRHPAHGQRSGACAGYLEPALDRPNLPPTHRRAGQPRWSSTASGASASVPAGRPAVHGPGRARGDRLRRRHPVTEAADAVRHRTTDQLARASASTSGSTCPAWAQNFHDHPLIIGPIGYLDRARRRPARAGDRGRRCSGGSEPGSRRTGPGDLPGAPGAVRRPVLRQRHQAGRRPASRVAPVARAGRPARRCSACPGWCGRCRAAGSGWPAPIRRRTRGLSANYFGERADLERMTTMVQMARDIYADEGVRRGLAASPRSRPGPTVTIRAGPGRRG